MVSRALDVGRNARYAKALGNPVLLTALPVTPAARGGIYQK